MITYMGDKKTPRQLAKDMMRQVLIHVDSIENYLDEDEIEAMTEKEKDEAQRYLNKMSSQLLKKLGK